MIFQIIIIIQIFLYYYIQLHIIKQIFDLYIIIKEIIKENEMSSRKKKKYLLIFNITNNIDAQCIRNQNEHFLFIHSFVYRCLHLH